MVSIASIFLSLGLLIFLAYRGFSVLVLSPLLAIFAVILSGGEPLLAYYTQIFMVKLGDFATLYFPLFLLSAVFGKIMENSGSARSLANFISKKIGAEHAILAVVLSCSVLTYGGVSLFVVVFAIYPLAVELFRKSETPKVLMPASIALGSFTYTMVSLPGTPAIQNAIPAQYFGTDTFAAPFIGIFTSICIFVGGMWWLQREYKRARQRGEGYGNYTDNVMDIGDIELPSTLKAFIPIVMVIVIDYICVKCVFPNIDTSYLAHEKYGSTDIKTVASNWAIIISLFSAIVFLLLTSYKKIDITTCMNKGAQESLAPIFNTASVVGYGAVINSLPAFSVVRDFVLNLSPGNPIISGSFSTMMLSCITGSASGGLSITLDTLGAKYMEMAQSINLDPEILHRMICISSASMDATPHNGAIITLLAICGLTHKQAFKQIFVSIFVLPCIITVSIILAVAYFYA